MDILFAKTDFPALTLPSCPGMLAASCQCVGDRDEQQDACGAVARGSAMLAVVADGMGGLARGGAAAALAVDTALGQSAGLLEAGANYDGMKALLAAVNDAVYRCIDVRGLMGMAGTTVCAAVVEGRRLRLFWSGDSRAYLWREGNLRQLTEDHVYARYLREMVAEGVLSTADAQRHPRRSHLTGYIGMRELEDYSITAGALALEPDDRLLLCTDGLYKCLDEPLICRCMAMDAPVAAQALIRQIARRRAKGQDNATALVLQSRAK